MRQEQIEAVIEMLPKLQYGLDVNLKFSGVSEFEFTQELSVFDAFGVSLYHGWIADPENRITSELVRPLTYNHICYKIVEYDSLVEVKSDFRPSSEDEDIQENNRRVANNEILKSFLADTASQLTFTGLELLHRAMAEQQLAVFFRNNHFSTVYKDGGKLFLLVTDLGYADEPSVVWEGLDMIDGYDIIRKDLDNTLNINEFYSRMIFLTIYVGIPSILILVSDPCPRRHNNSSSSSSLSCTMIARTRTTSWRCRCRGRRRVAEYLCRSLCRVQGQR